MADFVVDSSVLVSSLIASDKFFTHGVSAVEKILTRRKVACSSVIVPVEVAGAIARRTGDRDSAREAMGEMRKWVRLGLLELVDVNRRRMEQAQELAVRYSIKGMDALVVQVSDESSLPLLTFDGELAARISSGIRTISTKEL